MFKKREAKIQNATSEKQIAISVNNFTKRFGKFVAVKDASFNVSKGSIHGFVGPNGSGKTTTIKTLIGAYRLNDGELKVFDYKAGSVKSNKLIGYIPERASFPKYMTAKEYLITMAELSGMKRRLAKQKADEILKSINLEKHANRKPFSFSSGMQKKIALAQALLTEPEVLIFDEPAANLDPTARKELFRKMVELKNQGKTILISSHVMSELERIIDEVTFIYYGEVVFSGQVADFIKNNSTIYIKTSDNKKLVNYLIKNNISYAGAISSEIEIKGFTLDKVNSLVKKIIAQKIDIMSIRANDLQTAYENMAAKIHRRNKRRGDK